MAAKINRNLLIIICLCSFGAPSALAQAIMNVSTSGAVAADIGYAELTGPVTLTVASGITVDAPILVFYTAPIVNNNASEISVSGTGNLSGVSPSPSLDYDANTILINVPSGGTPGNSITISGVRVAIANHDYSQVSASISFPSAGGNSITAGQGNPIVVQNVAKPFSVEEGNAIELVNGVPLSIGTTFLIEEGFPGAFSSAVGVAGQTVPTRIRITPFPSIPEGIKVIFEPLVVSTETGATLTTLTGMPETVPREDGSMDVVYQFASAANSPVLFESFQIQIVLDTNTEEEIPLVTGTIQFQAELLPIGREIPTPQFPSTDIPRYAERLTPDELELVTGTTELVFPFRSESDGIYTGISITNPNGYRAEATLTAYSADGSLIEGDGITNPVSTILPANGQYAKVASEIFGGGFNASSPGTIRVAGKAPNLKGFYFIQQASGPGFDGSTGNTDGSYSWYLPLIFREGDMPFNRLEFYNPGDGRAAMTLEVLDADGFQVSSATEEIGPGSLIVRNISDIVELNLGSFQGGYIRGSSDLPLVIRDDFGNSLESNILLTQAPVHLTSWYLPFVASGDGFSTELTFVNITSRDTAEISLNLFDREGKRIAVDSNPASLSIMAGAQLIRTAADLFPDLGNGLTTGYLRVDVKQVQRGPFITVPGLIGAVRIGAADGSASTALPLVVPPSSRFIYSHLVQDSDYFTGLALLNPNAESANFEIDIYAKDGSLVGSFASQLKPGEQISKLPFELIPASMGQTGGYLSISSELPLSSISLLGTHDGHTLGVIPQEGLE